MRLPVKEIQGVWFYYKEQDIVKACQEVGCEQKKIKKCLESFRNIRSRRNCLACFLKLCDMQAEPKCKVRSTYNASAIYDKEMRSLYIRLSDTDVAKTKKLKPCEVLVDLDSSGDVVAIEIKGIQVRKRRKTRSFK